LIFKNIVIGKVIQEKLQVGKAITKISSSKERQKKTISNQKEP